MKSQREDIKTELSRLIDQGHELYCSFMINYGSDKDRKEISKLLNELNPNVSKRVYFNTYYEIWYSEALLYIKLVIPDREKDFVSLYKDERRKEINVSTYTVSDAILGTKMIRGMETIVSPLAAASKLYQQISMLEGAKKLIDSVIYSLKFTVLAELFDSEIDAAKSLFDNGFYRAAGAMCGALLKKHLQEVCMSHKISIKKKNPGISDYIEELKKTGVIEMPMWRKIQYLGDLRNICCHNKQQDPTKDQVKDLIDGTIQVCKTVF